MRTRVVFFGTPDYAVPALEMLANRSDVEIALVVTQPDRPAGRGHRLLASPVKAAAERLSLPVYQPASLRAVESRLPLADARADLFVVAAFGLIFGDKTLGIPKLGALNLHASILPGYRGASPIAAAILCGDQATGVSLMVMERGLDSGPVVAIRETPIKPEDTTESLTARLGELGASLLADELDGFVSGRTKPVPQPEQDATFVRPLRKSDGEIDWSRSATEIERHVRAMWPWPRAWSHTDGRDMQIHAAGIGDDSTSGERGERQPGELLIEKGNVEVICGSGTLRIDTVQFAGKRPMQARDAVAGNLLRAGQRFTTVVPNREPIVTTITSDSSTTA